MTPAPPAPGATAATPLEAQIVEVVRELLLEQGKERAAQNITAKSSFQNDLGLSSLDLVELVVRCETRLEVEVPEEIAEQADTAAGWAKAIREGSEQSAAKSVYRIVPPAADPVALPESARDLAAVLRWHSEAAHGRVHLHLLREGEGRGITCDQLLTSASQVGRGLIALGLVRNDPVAILLPGGADFFDAFLGVTLSGGIPVPLYPPADASRIAQYVERQTHILRNAGIRFLIAFGEVAPVARLLRVNLPSLIDITTVPGLRELGARTSTRFPDPSAIALIQYTSGTTENPRGAVLTHEAVLSNVRAIGRAVNVRPDDAVVSWLPMASDLGLVGCWLFSLYHAAPLTLLSPLEFLERPESWLWAIHDSRATLSAAPNFAYEICAQRVPLWSVEGIDLSCWRAAVNAGEAVVTETVERFCSRFAAAGFRREAMMPAYGLSESAVALAMPPPGRGPVMRNGVYSVGAPVEGHEARIVDDAGREIADGSTGRLQFRGPSQAAGYWNNGGATGATFQDGWVDSGDLAFRIEGELHIAGRVKDVIVRNGRQIPVEPLERAVGAVAGVRLHSVAVVGVRSGGTEELAILAECTAEPKELARAESFVRQAVIDCIGEEASVIRLIPPGTLPMTANQKIRREEARRLLAGGAIGATPAAPAFQMAGLWWANAGGLLRRGFARSVRGVGQAMRTALARAVASVLAASGSRAAVQAGARTALGILGRRPTPEGTQMHGPVVIVANRSNEFDAMSVVSLVENDVTLAGPEALFGLPEWGARLLAPLVAKSREEIETALRAGRTVVVFPDSPLGTAVLRNRYHLRGFEAAVAAGAPLIPFGLQIIRNQLFFRLAEKIPAAGADPRALRQQVREAIRKIYA